MTRISSTTTQQSAPISSSAPASEAPVVSEEKELLQPAGSHAEAERKNALTRQSENDLTAMLQKEKINSDQAKSESIETDGGARAGVDM